MSDLTSGGQRGVGLRSRGVQVGHAKLYPFSPNSQPKHLTPNLNPNPTPNPQLQVKYAGAFLAGNGKLAGGSGEVAKWSVVQVRPRDAPRGLGQGEKTLRSLVTQ